MHQHPCKHCHSTFVCNEPADECFQGEITCNDCFKKHDLPKFIFVLIVGIAVIGLALWLFGGISRAN